jgi:hypothetical protein
MIILCMIMNERNVPQALSEFNPAWNSMIMTRVFRYETDSLIRGTILQLFVLKIVTFFTLLIPNVNVATKW